MRPFRFLILGAGTLVQSCIIFGSCFSARTRVSTRHGRVPISRIRVGDDVLSFDTERDEVVERKVTRVFVHEDHQVGTLGALSGVTENHPVYDARTNTFVRADAIDSSAQLLRHRGDHLELVPSEAFHLLGGAPERVFNLSVEGTETYFAGGVLVHNKTWDTDDDDGWRNEPCSVELPARAEACNSTYIPEGQPVEIYSPEAACALPGGAGGAGGVGGFGGSGGLICDPDVDPEMFKVAHVRVAGATASGDDCQDTQVTITPLSGPIYLEVHSSAGSSCGVGELLSSREISEPTTLPAQRWFEDQHLLMVSLNREPVHVQLQVN